MCLRAFVCVYVCVCVCVRRGSSLSGSKPVIPSPSSSTSTYVCSSCSQWRARCCSSCRKACFSISFLNSPCLFPSSSVGWPHSAIQLWSRTATVSAFFMVDRRWAMITTVLPVDLSDKDRKRQEKECWMVAGYTCVNQLERGVKNWKKWRDLPSIRRSNASWTRDSFSVSSALNAEGDMLLNRQVCAPVHVSNY